MVMTVHGERRVASAASPSRRSRRRCADRAHGERLAVVVPYAVPLGQGGSTIVVGKVNDRRRKDAERKRLKRLEAKATAASNNVRDVHDVQRLLRTFVDTTQDVEAFAAVHCSLSEYFRFLTSMASRKQRAATSYVRLALSSAL
jgi:hypothetical protein